MKNQITGEEVTDEQVFAFIKARKARVDAGMIEDVFGLSRLDTDEVCYRWLKSRNKE